MEKYIQMIADITNEEESDIKSKMDTVKILYGIPYKEYFDQELYLLSEGLLAKKAAKIQRGKNLRKEAFAHIKEVTGMSRKKVIAEVKRINQLGIKRINVLFYDKFELYKMDDEKLIYTLGLLKRRDVLKVALQEDYTLEAELEEYYKIVEVLMTDAVRQKAKETFINGRKGYQYDEDKLNQVLIDMEVCRMLLGFSFSEYVCFRFEGKDIAEKRSFISNRERMEILSEVNADEGCELLNSKVECYKVLGKYYQRKQIYVQSLEDFPKFESFCCGLRAFVKKSVAMSMGKGIEPIYLEKDTDLRQLMERLIEESGAFVAEEMITPHRKIKKLNASSVNTVRVETFFDGEKTVVHDAFMRIGQSGSFVDNAGSGGIFVAVDPKTGVLTSHGYDERGNIYIVHPETQVPFKGFRLPAWRKALRLCNEVSDKVPGVKFIGWDLAYTHKRKWVIVEGNAKPQIICNQTAQEKGLREAFEGCIKG